MADKISPEKRSRNMSRIRSRDTAPEKTVRSLLYKSGYRYRKNVKGLSGTPDLVLKKYNTIIFVNGCFWHGHNCHLSSIPKSNSEFWLNKIKGNIERDDKKVKELLEAGWRVLVIWECSVKGKTKLDKNELLSSVKSFFDSSITDACKIINIPYVI